MSEHQADMYDYSEHVRSLLGYIEVTGQLIHWNKAMASMALSEAAQLIPRKQIEQASETAVSIAEGTINQELMAIRGIPHYFDDTETGRRVPCLLTSWLGIDPEAKDQHLWGVNVGQSGAVVSFKTNLYDEIRDTLQS